MKKNTILYTILDWGLGHATRSIPIINQLLNKDCEVIIASNGRALKLLQVTYPKLKFLELPDYDFRYYSKNMFLNMMLQWYKLPLAIYKEHRIVKKYVNENSIDRIISDNRYGCYVQEKPSVIITHQLNILTGNSMLDWFAKKMNDFWLNNFNQIWIPDFKGSLISGKLSLNSNLKNIYYLGVISRMELKKVSTKRDVIVLLSGPEPQRTYFEAEIIKEAKKAPFQFLIVGGKTEKLYTEQIASNIEYYSFMSGNALNNAILESKYIISRSGYTTLMDLAFLNKKALLVPTPGQTEQEYLAKSLDSKNIFPFQYQSELDIEQGIEAIKKHTGFSNIVDGEDTLSDVLDQFLIAK